MKNTLHHQTSDYEQVYSLIYSFERKIKITEVLELYVQKYRTGAPGAGLKSAKQTTFTLIYTLVRGGRRGGLMVSALDSGASAPGSSPGRGHFVVFLGKTLYSHSASLHPGVQMGTSELLGKT